jgi:hypothetical protein
MIADTAPTAQSTVAHASRGAWREAASDQWSWDEDASQRASEPVAPYRLIIGTLVALGLAAVLWGAIFLLVNMTF